MSADGEYFLNESVQVGKTLTIATRGLTPNQIHFPTLVTARGITGFLGDFYHGASLTTIGLYIQREGRIVEVTVPHLEEIQVASA